MKGRDDCSGDAPVPLFQLGEGCESTTVRRLIPPCHNRPPYQPGRTVHGIDQQTGSAVSVRLSNDWFADRCTQRDGVGIGRNNENFADAHGFDCRGCRWLPEEYADAR